MFFFHLETVRTVSKTNAFRICIFNIQIVKFLFLWCKTWINFNELTKTFTYFNISNRFGIVIRIYILVLSINIFSYWEGNDLAVSQNGKVSFTCVRSKLLDVMTLADTFVIMCMVYANSRRIHSIRRKKNTERLLVCHISKWAICIQSADIEQIFGGLPNKQRGIQPI